MKPEIRVLSLIASWLLIGVAIAQSDKTILNRALDSDLKLQVNDGGTASDVLTIKGSNSAVGINNTDPIFPLSLNKTTTSTTGFDAGILQIKRQSSADMIDGYGLGMVFSVEDSAAVSNQIAEIGASREGADNSGALIMRTANAGSMTEKLRVNPNGDVTATGSIASPQFNTTGSAGTFSGEHFKVNEGSFFTGFFTTVTDFSGVTCTSSCSGAAAKISELGYDVAKCLDGWRRGSASNVGCGSGAGGFSNVCLCIGVRAP